MRGLGNIQRFCGEKNVIFCPFWSSRKSKEKDPGPTRTYIYLHTSVVYTMIMKETWKRKIIMYLLICGVSTCKYFLLEGNRIKNYTIPMPLRWFHTRRFLANTNAWRTHKIRNWEIETCSEAGSRFPWLPARVIPTFAGQVGVLRSRFGANKRQRQHVCNILPIEVILFSVEAASFNCCQNSIESC